MLLQKVLLHKKFLLCENNKTEQQILPKVIFGYIPFFVNTLKIIDDFKLILNKEDYILFYVQRARFRSKFFACVFHYAMTACRFVHLILTCITRYCLAIVINIDKRA